MAGGMPLMVTQEDFLVLEGGGGRPQTNRNGTHSTNGDDYVKFWVDLAKRNAGVKGP